MIHQRLTTLRVNQILQWSVKNQVNRCKPGEDIQFSTPLTIIAILSARRAVESR
jgi:hypothetical protein